MDEGGKAGAEVIQREAHAQLAKRLHGGLHLLAAAHDGGFGKLELEPVRIDGALVDQPRQCRQQLAVLELPERQVDRHVQRVRTLLVQALQVAQGAGDDPVAERHDQAAFLGHGNEGVRPEQTAFGMQPTHQRLDADHAARVQTQPRLVVQLQLTTAQRAAQLALLVGQAAGTAADVLVVQAPGAALAGLGLTHRQLRMPEQRIGRGAGAGSRQPEAAAEHQAFAIHPVGFGQRLDDAIGDRIGAPGIVTGVEQQGELVATQPRQQIAHFQLRLEPGDHLQDQAISGIVAEGVVDVAEIVQVQVAELQAMTVVLAQGVEQLRLEALTIGDAGVRVAHRKLLQGALQVAALAHVAQTTAQHLGAELVGHQPVDRTFRGFFRLLVEQQDQRPGKAPRCGSALRRRQDQTGRFELLADGLPVRRHDQLFGVGRTLQAGAQPHRPVWAMRQQQQWHGLGRRWQAASGLLSC